MNTMDTYTPSPVSVWLICGKPFKPEGTEYIQFPKLSSRQEVHQEVRQEVNAGLPKRDVSHQ